VRDAEHRSARKAKSSPTSAGREFARQILAGTGGHKSPAFISSRESMAAAGDDRVIA